MRKEIQAALDFAAEKHSMQFRKGIPLPYLYHLLAVMKLLLQWGVRDVEVLLAALLHDTLEDTETTFEEIEELFGTKVANWVLRLTHNPTLLSKPEYMASFHDVPVQALVIKIADRICNVRDYLEEQNDYAEKYFGKAEILWKALFDRREEIVETFGSDIHLQILDSHSQLYTDLFGVDDDE